MMVMMMTEIRSDKENEILRVSFLEGYSLDIQLNLKEGVFHFTSDKGSTAIPISEICKLHTFHMNEFRKTKEIRCCNCVHWEMLGAPEKHQYSKGYCPFGMCRHSSNDNAKIKHFPAYNSLCRFFEANPFLTMISKRAKEQKETEKTNADL